MTNQQLERVVQKIYPAGKLLRAWELKGGVSAQVTALEIQDLEAGQLKVVLRQHGDADVQQNPHVAADEFRLLQILHSAGLAAPAPHLLDQSSEIFPKPYIVVGYIEGEPAGTSASLNNVTSQLATQLARIHNLDCAKWELSFLPRQEERCARKLKQRPAVLDHSLDEGHIRAVLEAAWPMAPLNPPTLLHGDYWPGNTLWQDGKLAGVIDWEDAAIGDPLADLGNARLEILWAYGLDAMLRFTDHYCSLRPVDLTHLPYWDLYAALRPASQLSQWALDEATERKMRARHHLFITQAFNRLAR
jgi:aminoglycoside phosphotransferase (APT) family kinase protein